MEQGYIDAKWEEEGSEALPANSIAYEDLVETIRENLQSVKESFISIGHCLKTIRDHRLYEQDPEMTYGNIYEFAQQRLRISKSTASRLIRLCEEFSEGQNSPRLAAAYEEFNYSQLSEMIPMKPEDRRRIKPNMTVQRIRDEKKVLQEIIEDKKNKMQKKTAIPKLNSDKARGEWLANVEAWEGRAWHEDEKIGATYYKADFPDGCRLIAVRYKLQPDAEDDSCGPAGDVCGKTHYRMLYSDWHLLDCTEKEYKEKHNRDFMDARATIPELKSYLRKWGTDSQSCQRTVEFDTGHLEAADDKSLPYLTRRYIKFYKKHGHIPKYFNAHSCRSFTDTAPTLTTSSGSFTGIGALTIFSLDENLERIREEQAANPGLCDAESERLRDAGSQEDREPQDVGKIRFFVRRLTPEEAARIMGISPEKFQEIKNMATTEQEIFKLLGNAISPQPVTASCANLKGAVNHPSFLT